MNGNRFWIFSVCLLAGCGFCSAAAWADRFDFPKAADTRVTASEVFAAWNARGAQVQKPGVKVIFFGRAEGCDPDASNGPVSSRGGRFAEALALTGVPLGDDAGLRWAPSGKSEQCDRLVHGAVADSFVHINPDPVKGGIGMFTYTGTNRSGRKSFFRQFDKGGKGGSGANANIEGTFITFRPDERKKQTIRPWSGMSATDVPHKAEFRTTQTIATFSLGEAHREGEIIQAKQQLVLTFINPVCNKGNVTKKMRCRFKYLFNTAVFRSGVTDWGGVPWFRHADIFFDPVQAGMPILHGPITPRGSTVKYKNTELGLYDSLGEPSQHGLFHDKQFRIQVSFEQFKNALRAVTARSVRKQIGEVTGEDIRSQFGTAWDDPEQWVLFNTAIGQEVVNPQNDGQAYIGGGIREIYVGAAKE